MARKIITRAKRASVPDITLLRMQLFQASGICHAVRGALASQSPTDEVLLQSALQAAGNIVDDVASKLEGVS